jgi:Tetratricopeptide repeat/SPOR domain/WD40-like Beta Propeller Repeat
MRYLFFLLLLALTMPEIMAQTKMSACKHRKTANKLFDEYRYAEAAGHYEQAFAKKPKKLDLQYRAAECHYALHNYAAAAKAFEPLKDKTEKYPLAGLYYARSLKQLGQYESAYKAYAGFSSSYTGADKETYLRRAQNEMRGCELGARVLAPGRKDSSGVEFSRLAETINTPSTEFAPIPFGDGVLYFSSTRAGTAKIFRSQLTNGKWSSAEVPKGFPDLGVKHFANGSFSSESNRFYFTQCESVAQSGGVGTRCKLFMMERTSTGWTIPTELPAYINMDNSTTTQPSVAVIDGQEYLFFASDREGGQGGLDIWYTSRPLKSNGLDFTLPKNVGTTINTVDRELTPFFDMADQRLYFSSDGHVGIGGLDIYMSSFRKGNFETAEHLDAPFNSAADDYYFTLAPDGQAGYIASNRAYGATKPNTTDDDLFLFTPVQNIYTVSGRVMAAGQGLNGANVSLYEMTANEQKRLLQSKDLTGSTYSFELLPSRRYRIESSKAGYFTSIYELETDPSRTEIVLPIELDLASAPMPSGSGGSTAGNGSKPSGGSGTKPGGGGTKPNGGTTTGGGTKPSGGTTTGGGTKPSGGTTTGGGTKPSGGTTGNTGTTGTGTATTGTRKMKPKDGSEELVTTAPMRNGVYYKIQLQAVKDVKDPKARLSQAQALSRVDTEFIPSKGLYRMLLGDFASIEDAQHALKSAQTAQFKEAFIVRYENGVRVKNGM